jgi:hypothetical protein
VPVHAALALLACAFIELAAGKGNWLVSQDGRLQCFCCKRLADGGARAAGPAMKAGSDPERGTSMDTGGRAAVWRRDEPRLSERILGGTCKQVLKHERAKTQKQT